MRKLLTNILKYFWGRKRLSVVIIIVLAVAGYFIKNTFFPSTKGVESAKIEKGMVREELILSGEIRADEYANLSFQTSGELDFVGVSIGEEVKKDQLMARLDTNNLYQVYLQAESDLRYYQSVLDRVYDQVKGHDDDESLAQKETRTQAEANKDNAYRSYVIAQKNLANASLKAPFDGVVTGITNPFSGINTFSSQSQIEIVNPETIFFEVSADQSEVTEISKGQKVVVVLDSYPDEEFQGVVEYVGLTPKLGEVGAVYEVKVRFSDAELDVNKFRIGMTGDAKFILDQKEGVLFVPPAFINSDSKGTFVNLGKTNNKVYVESGLEGEERVEVKGNIKEGATVYD